MDSYCIYYHYASGSKYEGQWSKGLGIGTFYNSRGLKYIGECLKGRFKTPYYHKKTRNGMKEKHPDILAKFNYWSNSKRSLV